jgi:hypothetical protein
MAHARRRLLFSAALVLVIVLLGAGGSFRGSFIVHALNEDANAGFDPISPVGPVDTTKTANPPRLYAGDLSHPLPARSLDDPIPAGAGPTNGYCLTLKTGGLVPASGPGLAPADLGFTLTGINPIDPTSAATVAIAIPVNGLLKGAAGPAALPTVNGDKYCVVAQAPVGYKTLKVSWTYLDASSIQHTITLNDPTFIPVVTVTLKATAIGNVGQVCTVGWDPSFLTGHASNFPNTNVPPDKVNIVALADWVLFNTSGGAVTLNSVQPDVADSTQWCVSMSTTPGVAATTDITLSFDAVYNRQINPDDRLHTATLSPGPLLSIPGTFALAHIGWNGEVLTQQTSPALVIGAVETACILGSDGTDTLNPSDIIFSNSSGSPDVASVSSLTVFHAGAGITVAAGTLCFTYSSSSAGEHAINATFFDTSAGISRGVHWTNGALIVQWNRIDSTLITTSSNPSDTPVTFTTITAPLQFNVADGTFLTSNMKLSEFVIGSHKAQGQTRTGYLQGVGLTATLAGGCGYFVVPDNSKPTTITGTSVGGRFELTGLGDTDGNPDDVTVSITNSGGCNAGSVIRVNIDAFYPGKVTPALATEYVDVNFTYIPPNKTPRLAWAGQVVPITYAFSSSSTCAGQIVHFVRPDNQRGSFLGGTGLTLNGPGDATGDFGAGCSLTVNYLSPDPGEVDIEVFVTGNPYSKVAFPIFYLAFEDATATAPATSVVSTVGYVDVVVRGYFVGPNPSGHPAETKPDGRRVPADRWVLPDDWETLKGSGDFRGNWSGAADMPAAVVTFLMQNEQVANNFKTGVKNGGLGWFMHDAIDVKPPEVGRVPDAKGVIPKLRTFVDTTDLDGKVTALTFGDLNLSYEGCAKSAENGNPQCKPEDVIGHTVYYVAVDYPANIGKYPPISSNTTTTEWTWAGYKSVTVVNTDSPSMKYVVAHLRDRDGYCDAAAFNNTLGVPVRFEIDAGGGTILEAQNQPSSISSNKRFATATTFDTKDDLGNAINQDLAKTVVQDDECQAWIKVSNSLLQPTNVIVTFPAPPSPVPGNIRITGLSCDANLPTITVTNKGANLVSLEGFALRSLPTPAVLQEEHLGLSGLLAPGQSKTFSGYDPGWINVGTADIFGLSGDYARLVWNGFELSRALCNGTFTTPAIPDTLPLDGEGEIVIDIVIPFGQEKQVALTEGWNLLGGGANPTDLSTAFAGHENDFVGVYGWNATTGVWTRYLALGPSFLNTMERLEAGQVYWVEVKRPFTLSVMK